jgi:polyhydroxybutyrate depolymerase
MKKCVVLLVLAACGGGDTDPPDRPMTYGGDRPVELQVPTAFEEGQEYPLVILLHGYTATGILQSAYLGLADLPTDPGVFYMTPDGLIDDVGNHYWNASAACCAGSASNPPDDVAYIGGLIDDVMADWPVDAARVFLIGHSNGHFMSYRMACERADVITAIAGLAGGATTVDGANCDPADDISILHIHGDADTVVPYQGGGLDAPYPGAVGSVQQWAEKNGCDTELTAGDRVDIVDNLAGAETRTEAAGCSGTVGVELWTIEEGSHIPNVTDTFPAIVTGWLLDHARE